MSDNKNPKPERDDPRDPQQEKREPYLEKDPKTGRVVVKDGEGKVIGEQG